MAKKITVMRQNGKNSIDSEIENKKPRRAFISTGSESGG
jgi:hypothetical protein